MTPIKFKITRVPMTAATSGRKFTMVLYILFIVVLCSLLIVTGPRSIALGKTVLVRSQWIRAEYVYRLRWEICQAFFFHHELPSGCTGCSSGLCSLARNTDQRETGLKRGELHPDPARLLMVLGR